jgi:hypothetical protein
MYIMKSYTHKFLTIEIVMQIVLTFLQKLPRKLCI